MQALIVQHVDVEGPGSLASCLVERGWGFDTVALHTGAALPAAPQHYDAIIVMGGPMGVDDEASHPFLRAEQAFLLQALAQGTPLLGICLGAQLLAKALGARVYRNAQKEIGWYTVDLTADGRTEPLFAGLTSPLPVFQWHGDAFELPAGATALASSPLCTHQAFRYGDRVYGLLFHLELTPAVIHTWIEAFQEELAGLRGDIDPQRIVAEIPQRFPAYEQAGRCVMTNLLARIWEPLAANRMP